MLKIRVIFVVRKGNNTMTEFKKILIPVALFVSILVNVLNFSYIDFLKNPNNIQKDTVTVKTADTLGEWEIFTLALMKVESEYDNSAVSSVGARGYFQITPIYVKEVNRMHNTNFTFDQVTDFETAYEIFDLMQKAHNPNYNMDKALELHNGKHDWYKRRVYNEMGRIRQYEKMRMKLKSI